MLTVQRRNVVLPREQINLVLRAQRTLLLVPRDGRGDRPPFPAGGTIALQPGVTRPATCRAVVRRITDIALGELDDAQARALGYDDLDDAMAAWVAAHGEWNENARAWLMQIAVDQAAPARLLHRDSSHGYTTRPHEALNDEPEAVDDEHLAAARRAATRNETDRFQQLLADRQRLPVSERMRRLEQDAAARAVEVTRDDWRAIERNLEALERKVYRPADRTPDLA